MRLVATGLVTGWGDGAAALPDDALTAAAGRPIITAATPSGGGERFRRATRECLLGVAAVRALLADAGVGRAAIAGGSTALLYVTAGAYGAANRRFIEADGDSGGALHFPYTAPSAVPAEVAIEFGLTGAYLIFVGGAGTTRAALDQAGRMLAAGAAERALVLAVETFSECADLYARGRWLTGRPLVEAAACAWLEPAPEPAVPAAADLERLEIVARRRAGETLACAPLVALALAGRAVTR